MELREKRTDTCEFRFARFAIQCDYEGDDAEQIVTAAFP